MRSREESGQMKEHEQGLEERNVVFGERSRYYCYSQR